MRSNRLLLLVTIFFLSFLFRILLEFVHILHIFTGYTEYKLKRTATTKSEKQNMHCRMGVSYSIIRGCRASPNNNYLYIDFHTSRSRKLRPSFFILIHLRNFLIKQKRCSLKFQAAAYVTALHFCINIFFQSLLA